MPRAPGNYTKRQLHAAELVVEGLSQTAAYQGAYGAANLTPRRRSAKASALFATPKMRALVARLREESLRRCQVPVDAVTKELAAVAFSSLPDLLQQDEDGMIGLKPLALLTGPQRRALKKVKVRRRVYTTPDGSESIQEIEIELHGKLEALELLGRSLGMFVQRVTLDAPLIDYRPEPRESPAVLPDGAARNP